MTSVTASNEQWYNKNWLVVLLCIFIFPVGVYALWKSERFSKGLKIGFTVFIGLLAYAAFNDGKSEAKEASKKEETKQQAKQSATPAPATGNAALTVDTTAAQPTVSLFDSPEDFKNAFNKYTTKSDLDFQIDEIEVKEGEVQNSFQYMFTDNLGILGTVNKSNGSVKEIMLMGTGDGTVKSGSDIILGIIAVIATTDPSLKPQDRIKILKDLKIMGDSDADITNLSTKTQRNGIKYFVNSSQTMGLWFGASKE